MSLEDLYEHAPAQQEAINRLLVDPTNPLRVPSLDLAKWVRFRNAVWGEKEEPWLREEVITRDTEDPIENDCVLPDTLPYTRFVITPPESLPRVWALNSRQILVRDEYRIAEQAAISANKGWTHVFVVTGQPGIGKSLFLLQLLLRRLALRLPTALQVDDSFAILFHEGGVSEFANLDKCAIYDVLQPPPRGDPERKFWALVNTSEFLPNPTKIFKDHETFFVVNATSPHSKHLDWLNKINHQNFYMKPWSLSEIIQARPFIGIQDPYTERQLWNLYDKFNATPRDLAFYTSDPIRYESLVLENVWAIDPNKLQQTFNNQLFDEVSHRILVIEPLPTNRWLFVKRIASRRVFEMLWEKHLKTRVSDTKYFYDLFRATTTMASGAGWVFEFRMHQLLTRQQTIRLFPITQDNPGPKNFIYKGYPGENPIDLQLIKSDEHPLFEDEFHANRYYRPTSTNFPTIDSLLIHPPDSPPILLAFQITRNKKEHDVNEAGLQRIDKMIKKLKSTEDTQNARLYFVVVTPEDVEPEIKVPKAYFGMTGNEKLPVNKVQVFNYPVSVDTLFSE